MTGPAWLRKNEIAENVCKTIELGAEPALLPYTFDEYVVMPHAVHVLLTGRAELGPIRKASREALRDPVISPSNEPENLSGSLNPTTAGAGIRPRSKRFQAISCKIR